MAAGQKLKPIEDRRPGESNWYSGDTHGSHPSTVKEGIKVEREGEGPAGEEEYWYGKPLEALSGDGDELHADWRSR
jgi:hypothetical protein